MGTNTTTEAKKSSSVEVLLSSLESERERLWRNLYSLQSINDKLESEPRPEEGESKASVKGGYAGHVDFLNTEVSKIQYANTFFETEIEKLKRHI